MIDLVGGNHKRKSTLFTRQNAYLIFDIDCIKGLNSVWVTGRTKFEPNWYNMFMNFAHPDNPKSFNEEQVFQNAQKEPSRCWELCAPIIHDLDQSLISRFGNNRNENWTPSQDSLFFSDTTGFVPKVKEIDEITGVVADQMGWTAVATSIEPRKVIINLDQQKSLMGFKLRLAEEMLHAWGLQKYVDFSRRPHFDESAQMIYGAAAMEALMCFLTSRVLEITPEKANLINDRNVQGIADVADFFRDNIGQIPDAENMVFQMLQTADGSRMNKVLDNIFEYTDNAHLSIYEAGAIYYMILLDKFLKIIQEDQTLSSRYKLPWEHFISIEMILLRNI